MNRISISLIGTLLLISKILFANEEIIIDENIIKKVYIAKKPLIKCFCPEIKESELITVYLDDNDITALVKKSENGIIFKSINILNGGEHTLSIIYTINGEEKQKDFTFKTRQSKNFETSNSTLSINPIYENTLLKPEDLNNIPYSKVESDFQLKTNLAEKRWSYSFNTDIRYFDQSIPLSSQNQTQSTQTEQNEEGILKKGFSLTTYLFNAKYKGDDFTGGLDIGDFSIDESDYSASGITKRGARANISYNRFDAEAFIANSIDYYGFYGGMGIEPNDKKRLYGVSIQKTFFEDTEFKIIYLKGGKLSEGFGEASDSFPKDDSGDEAPKKGNIVALVFSTPIIEEKLNLYAEYDRSKYDIDTTDEYGYEKDKAYNIKLNGALNQNYSYDFIYEYIGPNFYSIANESTQNDNEGFGLNLMADFDLHSITLSFSDYHDNVEDNNQFATVYNYDGSISYTYNGIENLPIDLSYERAKTKSKKEPTPDDKQNTITNTYSLNLGYMYNNWQFNLGTEYSKENDKINNIITKSNSYTFSPTYENEKFHLSPNFGYNISKTDDSSDSNVGTYKTEDKTLTIGLEIGYMILENLNFDISGTVEYTKNKEQDEIIGKEEKIDGSFQLTYNLKSRKNWLQNPIIGIKGTYSFTHDKIHNEQGEDLILTLFVTLPMQFIF